MYAAFHSNFAARIVYRRYKPFEFLGFIWTNCWGNESIMYCKKLQHSLQCFTMFTVKLLQRTTVSAIYSESLLFFFTFIFVKYCVFYSVKCKMLRCTSIEKNIVKYRDFLFNRHIRASILPTKYCTFCIFTVNL